MGTDKRRADIVLVDGKQNYAAIIECKRIGFQGEGREYAASIVDFDNAIRLKPMMPRHIMRAEMQNHSRNLERGTWKDKTMLPIHESYETLV